MIKKHSNVTKEIKILKHISMLPRAKIARSSSRQLNKIVNLASSLALLEKMNQMIFHIYKKTNVDCTMLISKTFLRLYLLAICVACRWYQDLIQWSFKENGQHAWRCCDSSGIILVFPKWTKSILDTSNVTKSVQ